MRIYLDHNATTPPRPEVIEAIVASLAPDWGNPSSVHAEGRRARAAIEEARESVASLIGAEPSEITFTSGGTEAANLAVRGFAEAAGGRCTILTTPVEHPCVSDACLSAAARGARVVVVPLGPGAIPEPEAFREASRLVEGPGLVSVMLANNETGLLHPVDKIAALAREGGLLVHTDAVQAVPWLPVNVRDSGADLLSLSAHKMGGPKGSGALYVRKGARIEGLQKGGGQERGLRPGTENLAGIVGLGKACDILRGERAELAARIERLRDRLERAILERIAGVERNGPAKPRLPNTMNLAFEGVAGESLVIALDLAGVAASAGSACHSGTVHTSRVLLAMGLSEQAALASLRLSLGWTTTGEEVDRALEVLDAVVGRLRTRGAAAGPRLGAG